ncbi:major facilitator superfamily transporter [Seiridium cupressi]
MAATEEKTSSQEDTDRSEAVQELGKHHSNDVVAEKQTATGGASDLPHGFRLVSIVVAITFSIFLMSLDQTIVATAIPKITDEFGGLDKVSWYGSVYFMTFGGFQSAWGKFYRYYPLKWTFVATMCVFEVGSLICGVAPNPVALIVGRAIAGVGGAGITTGGFTIIAFSASDKKRPMLTGIVGAVYGIGSVCGPILGGALTEGATWRWCFYINLPIGIVAAIGVALFFKAPSAAQPMPAPLKENLLQLDLPGVVLAMAAIVCFILGIETGGQTKPWNNSEVIGLLVGFIVILAALIGWEAYQGEYAMIVPRLFMKRVIGVGAIFQFCYAGAYFLLLYYLPIYFQSIDGSSPIESGVRNLPMVLAVSVAGIIGGTVVSKTGITTPFMIAGAAVTTVGCGLLYTIDIGTSSGKWIGYQILTGFASAFPFQITMNIAQANSEPQDMSSATAIIFFFQTLGGAFSVAAAQSAFVNTIVKDLTGNSLGIDPAKVIATGATQIRESFPSNQLDAILRAYMAGIKAAFIISIALAGASFAASLFSSYKRLHGGKQADVSA